MPGFSEAEYYAKFSYESRETSCNIDRILMRMHPSKDSDEELYKEVLVGTSKKAQAIYERYKGLFPSLFSAPVICERCFTFYDLSCVEHRLFLERKECIEGKTFYIFQERSSFAKMEEAVNNRPNHLLLKRAINWKASYLGRFFPLDKCLQLLLHRAQQNNRAMQSRF